MIVSPMKHKDFIKVLIESAEDERLREEAKREQYSKSLDNFDGLCAVSESIISTSAIRTRNQNKYNTFVESVKCSLLGECIYKVFSESIDSRLAQDHQCEAVARSLISNWIQEKGVNDILSDMRTKSYVLSEFHDIVMDTVKSLRESIDMDDSGSLVMHTDIREKFFDKLDMTEVGDVTDAIGQRVAAATEDFLRNNAEDKQRIKEILTDTRDKVEDINKDKELEDEDKEDIIESYNMVAKRKITEIRAKNNNIFGTMVMETAIAAMKDKNDGPLHMEFMSEGRIDMPKIVDRVSVMYTFLETINTMKLEKIDEAYLDEVITSIKD